MTIFVDASALIAIVAPEPDAENLARRLASDDRRCISALAIWEALIGLSRSRKVSLPDARLRLDGFCEATQLRVVSIGQPEFEQAAEAYARFGKGRHVAALNMGDCFAYACARTNDARLLFKGDDFGKTDIGSG